MSVVSGVRVVLDARPLQKPERSPTTALYLDRLLRAFAADPPPGETFLFLLDSPGRDPSSQFPGLRFAGRRRLPPTRRLRAAALTLDPFLLRAASIGAFLGTAGEGAGGTVYHVAGGTLPLASGLPTVATLLDLAPWELPAVYQRNLGERFGQRLRARLLHDAGRIIVASEATARAASRFLSYPRERIHVVRLAPTLPGLAEAGRRGRPDQLARIAELRDRLRLPEHYLLFWGQYDARKDIVTLLRSLSDLATVLVLAPWAASADAAAVVGLIDREGAWPHVQLTPSLDPLDQATLLAGARALVYPALVEGSGLPVLDALAAGVPVVASNVGALPEIVGDAGILVEPRDPRRLAAALSAVWLDERLRSRLERAATKRARTGRRTWNDVAAETRAVYALAAAGRRG